MSDENLVRQNINYLEYPLWFQEAGETDENTVSIWESRDGYSYQTSHKWPVKVDSIFLLFLLLKSQNNDWNDTLTLTRFEILMECGFGRGRHCYERLEDSLHRWASVLITFKGTFYNGEAYKSMQFGIIDSWKIKEKSNKLEIRFSKEWLESIQHSNFVKMLDFEKVKSLKSPLATRLHEILIKNFKGRNTWSCGAKKLAGKIPMKEEYPAHIIPKIKTAVGRINEKTDLQIRLTVRRPERGKALFDFEKLESQPTTPDQQEAPKLQIVDVPEEQAESFKKLLALLPKKEQGKKTLRELLARKLRKEGPEFVRRNILYANKNAKSNYRVYLTKAFKEDWGEAYEEDIQQAQAANQAKQTAEEEKRQKEREEQRLEQQARETLQAMTPEEEQRLEYEARSRLEATNPGMLQGSFASAALKIQMNALLIERLKTFP